MRQAKPHIKDTVKELEIEMKKVLDSSTRKQIALREDARMSNEGFADRRITSENNVDHLERTLPTVVPSQNNRMVRQRLKYTPA